MKPSLLIADFTGVYAEEGFLQKLRERGVPYRRVGLGDIEGTTCYCDPDAEAEISRRLVPEPGERMRWIDSGDYHYVTKILAAREQAPFTLVLVDNHPDDQAPAFGGVLSCGSWVRDLREASPMLEEVWTLGPDHRIRNASGTVDRALEAGIDDLLEAVEGKRVYLSIDKDVLGGMVPDGLEPGDVQPCAAERLAGRPAEDGRGGRGYLRRTVSREGGDAGGPSGQW